LFESAQASQYSLSVAPAIVVAVTAAAVVDATTAAAAPVVVIIVVVITNVTVSVAAIFAIGNALALAIVLMGR
jgi:hypothetical protein